MEMLGMQGNAAETITGQQNNFKEKHSQSCICSTAIIAGNGWDDKRSEGNFGRADRDDDDHHQGNHNKHNH